jgi:hypothetical protein
MRKSSRSLWVGALVFGLAIFLLAGLGHSKPGRADDDPYATRLDLKEEEGMWLLHYSFASPGGKRREFTCKISKEGDRKLQETEGYLQQDWGRLDKELTRKLNDEAKREDAFQYGQAHVFGTLQGGWEWRTYSPVTQGDYAYHRDVQDRFNHWLAKEFEQLRADTRVSFMRSRGFRSHQGKWLLDYSNLLIRAAPELENCVTELNRATSGNAEVLMGFFQMMHYKKLEDVEGGRFTNGFRVPTSLLIKNEGDCDSKAATFCAIQRESPARLVIFRSTWPPSRKRSGHALVGVEAWKDGNSPLKGAWNDGTWKTQRLESILYGDPILIGNRYYIPVDVAGFGHTDFGRVLPGREGDYYVIPIRPLDRYIQSAPTRQRSHSRG